MARRGLQDPGGEVSYFEQGLSMRAGRSSQHLGALPLMGMP